MPDISAGAQVFDIAFHPTHSTVYAGLLTGHVKAFAFDDQALCLDMDGSHLFAVGKAKSLNIIDTVTEAIEIRAAAHDSTINRIKYLMPSLLSTGDDDGVIKLWDPRQRDCTRKYTQHFDYITDFLWLEDKKQLVATSGDGTLSVMDVRSKKPEPFAQSEDQEDELLSIVAIKGASKVVVGTQIGVLSIFNRSAGWGDCVDRVPGHPHSIDTICNLPPDLPGIDTSSAILTGSSDGFVRAVEILPTKLLGVVADHGDWPVERIAIGGGMSQLTLDASNEGVKNGSNVGKKSSVDDDADIVGQERGTSWVGSVGHEETLRLTDLGAFFHEAGRAGSEGLEGALEDDGEQQDVEDVEADENIANDSGPENGKSELEEESDDDAPKLKKRKRRPDKDPLAVKKKKGRNTVDVSEPAFFNDL